MQWTELNLLLYSINCLVFTVLKYKRSHLVRIPLQRKELESFDFTLSVQIVNYACSSTTFSDSCVGPSIPLVSSPLSKSAVPPVGMADGSVPKY